MNRILAGAVVTIVLFVPIHRLLAPILEESPTPKPKSVTKEQSLRILCGQDSFAVDFLTRA